MGAVTLIGRGASPFISKADRNPQRVTTYMGNVPGFHAFYMPDNSPLAKMDAEIPLECESIDLVEIPQVTPGNNLFETPLESTAFLPNCTFTSLRASGTISTMTTTLLQSQHEQHLRLSSTRNTLRSYLCWVQVRRFVCETARISLSTFELTPENRRFARDRDNWKRGREVLGVMDGMGVIGNLTIDFGTVVLATGGKESGDTTISEGEAELQEETEYGLVVEITSDCPPRASRIPTSDDVQCLAILTASCDTFGEDNAPFFTEIFAPRTSNSYCSLNGVRIIWGRNIVADSELIAVVAGIFGIIRPVFHDRSDRIVLRHGVLSAVFVGTVQERPSTEDVVRPRVNGVYIFLILLPLALSMIALLVAHYTREACLPIPKTPWELMLLSKESPLVPESSGKNGANLIGSDSLALAFFDARESDDEPYQRRVSIVPAKCEWCDIMNRHRNNLVWKNQWILNLLRCRRKLKAAKKNRAKNHTKCEGGEQLNGRCLQPCQHDIRLLRLFYVCVYFMYFLL